MDIKRLLLAGGLCVAAFIVFTQVKKLSTPVKVEVPTVAAPVVERVQYVDVLVATSEVPFGSRLSERHMRWKQWPAEAVSGDFISNRDNPQAITEFTGGVARSVIYEGEPISARKIIMPGNKGLMAALLTPGMRAVTTRISVDTAAGGFIQPGDHVDIILTSIAPRPLIQTRSTTQTYVAKTIFEDVRVLAIDQTFSSTSETGATVIGSTATFEMSQGDAEILQQSSSQGDLTLTLRPMGSSSTGRAAKSHARIERNDEEVSSLTVYRNGQPQQVAVTGQ